MTSSNTYMNAEPDLQLLQAPFEAPEAMPDSETERSARLRDFDARRKQRALERRLLPFLKTLVDFDICCEIGYHELTGTRLTVKHLLLLNLAPSVTIFRRLDRLCSLGVIVRIRSERDGRVHELGLTPAGQRLFATYSRLNQS